MKPSNCGISAGTRVLGILSLVALLVGCSVEAKGVGDAGPIGPTGATGPAGPQGTPGVPCAGCVNSASIAPGAVGAAQIADGGVTAPAIAAGAVGSAALAAGSVLTIAIADGVVTPAKLSGTIGAALAGTNGTPSGTNTFVTNSDPRNSNSRTPVVHGSALHDSTVATLSGGIVPNAQVGVGTANNGAYLRGDRTWQPFLILSSGQTLQGTYTIEFNAAAVGGRGSSPISFPIRLAAAPTTNFIATGGAANTNCPGSAGNPTALPGQLCVYETYSTNISTRCVASVGASYACNNSDTWGTTVFVTATAAGQATSVGSWAVTAP